MAADMAAEAVRWNSLFRGTSDAKKEYTEDDIPNILNDIKILEAKGRENGLILAPNALHHYVNGKGADFIVGSDFLLKFSSVTNAVEENQNRFLEHKEGILRHIKNLSHTDSHSFAEHFVKPIYANMLSERDLYYGSGGSKLSSHGNFSAKKSGVKIFVTGEVNVSWYDRYNWDHGKTTNVVGMGEFDDRRFAYLEEKGFAKSYNMVSSWKYSFSGTYDENSKKWEGVKWQRKK